MRSIQVSGQLLPTSKIQTSTSFANGCVHPHCHCFCKSPRLNCHYQHAGSHVEQGQTSCARMHIISYNCAKSAYHFVGLRPRTCLFCRFRKLSNLTVGVSQHRTRNMSVCGICLPRAWDDFCSRPPCRRGCPSGRSHSADFGRWGAGRHRSMHRSASAGGTLAVAAP